MNDSLEELARNLIMEIHNCNPETLDRPGFKEVKKAFELLQEAEARGFEKGRQAVLPTKESLYEMTFQWSPKQREAGKAVYDWIKECVMAQANLKPMAHAEAFPSAEDSEDAYWKWKDTQDEMHIANSHSDVWDACYKWLRARLLKTPRDGE